MNASAEDGDLKGDFLKNLEEVTLNGKNVLPAGAGQIGGEEDYQIKDGMIILGKNLFKEAGSYTLQLKANADAGYAPKTLKFEVKEAVETPAEEGKDVPEFREAVLKEESGYFAKDPYYQIFFDGVDLDEDGKTEDDVEDWLRSKPLAVYVDGVLYESGMSDDNTNRYTIQESDQYYKSVLAIRPAVMGGEHSVKITAEGYKVCEFTFTGSEIEQEVKDAPVFEKAEVKESYYGYGDYYKLTFSGSNARDFFNSDSLTVTVNGSEYTKLTNSYASVGSTEGSKIYAYDSYSYTPALELRPEDMSEDLEIIITAEGYKSCTFTVEGLSDEKVTPEFDKYTYVEAESSWDASYYRIDFAAEDDEALSKYLSDSSMVVTVNDEKYERSSSLSSSSTKTFVADGKMGAYGRTYSYLKLSADAFEEGDANEVEITVDGYDTITFTVGESDEIGNEDGDEFAPEVSNTKYEEKGIFNPAYYQVAFKYSKDKDEQEKIKEYLESDDLTVTVNGTEYSRVISKFQFKEKNFLATVRTADSGADEAVLEMTEDAFDQDVNTVVIEGGDGYGSITLTINKDGKLVTAATETTIDDIEVVVDTELPAEDEIIASDDKKEEISDEIIDEDENVSDDSNAKGDAEDEDNTSDDIKETDSADDTEDKADESEDAADDKSENEADDITDEDDAEDTDAADKDDADADEEESSENEADSDDADESETADAEEDTEAEME